MRPSLAYHLFLALIILAVKGALVNITVDDTLPDPLTGNTFQYAPADRWNTGPCPNCSAQPNPSSTYGGTWHDATYSSAFVNQDETQTAQIRFNGSAIYVFGILWNNGLRWSDADILFFIDGQQYGSYTHNSSGNGSYIYNVPLWANDSIGPGTHTFALQNGQAGGNGSFILLDYIIYSQERDDTMNTTIVSSNDSATFSTAAFATSSLPGNVPPAASSANALFTATPTVTTRGTDHTLMVVLVSVLTCLVAAAMIVLWFLRRRRISRRKRTENLLSSSEVFNAADIRPYLERNSTLMPQTGATSSNEQDFPATQELFTNKSTRREKASQPPVETIDGIDAEGISKTPGGRFEYPPAYDTLSSANEV